MVKFLRREGANNRVSALFYREIIQAVLIFGYESWYLLYVMVRAVEGTHVGFLPQNTGKRDIWQANRPWEIPVAE